MCFLEPQTSWSNKPLEFGWLSGKVFRNVGNFGHHTFPRLASFVGDEADMVQCETTGNCTAEQHDIEEEIKLDHQYSVSLDSFDDDDFEPGLMWKQDYFKPKGNVLPISAIIDIELQKLKIYCKNYN